MSEDATADPPALTNESSERPANPWRGLFVCFLGASIWMVSVGPMVRWGSESSGFQDAGELLLVAAVMCLTSITCLTIAFSFAVPLMLVRSASRYVLAVVTPALLWAVFIGGIALTADDVSLIEWGIIFSVLVAILAGLAIPAGPTIWMNRWHLRTRRTSATVNPFGIRDLLMLVTAGALGFAFGRQYGAMADDELELIQKVVYTLIPIVIGILAMFVALLAMRIVLAADGRPLRKLNVLGILLTIGLFAGIWIIIGKASPAGISVTGLVLGATASWLITAGCAYSVCWWLKRCGIELSNRRIESAIAERIS